MRIDFFSSPSRLVFYNLEQKGPPEIINKTEMPKAPLDQKVARGLEAAGSRICHLSDIGRDPSGAEEILGQIEGIGKFRITGVQMPKEQEIGKTNYPVALFQVVNSDGTVTDHRFTVEQLQSGQYPKENIADKMAQEQIDSAMHFKDEHIRGASLIGETMRKVFGE